MSRPGIIRVLVLPALAWSLAACARDGSEGTAKGPSLSCTADADCAVAAPFTDCCPGCGVAPEDHVALPLKEVERQRAKEERTCARRRGDCPLINCPVLRFCNDTKAVCAEGACALRLVPIPDCTEQRHDRPAATPPP